MAFISANIQREVEQATEATMGKKAVRSINIVQHPRDINKSLVTMEVNARYKKRTGSQRDSAKLLRKLLAVSDITGTPRLELARANMRRKSLCH